MHKRRSPKTEDVRYLLTLSLFLFILLFLLSNSRQGFQDIFAQPDPTFSTSENLMRPITPPNNLKGTMRLDVEDGKKQVQVTYGNPNNDTKTINVSVER
jgi:hypothetical protein